MKLSLVFALLAAGGALAEEAPNADIEALAQSYYEPRTEGLSADAFRARAERAQSFLDRLRRISFDELPVPDQVDFLYFESQLDYTLHQIEGLQRWKRDPTLYLPFDDFYRPSIDPTRPWPDRVEAMIAGLNAGPERLRWARENLENPPLVWTEEAIGSIDRIRRYLKDTLPRHGERAPELSARLTAAGKALDSDLGEFQSFLDTDLRARPTSSFAVGPENYQRLLKNRFMDYSPEELLALGKRVHAETERLLEETAREIDPRKTWQEIFQENLLDFPPPWELHTYLQREANRGRELVYERVVNVPPGLVERYEYIEAGYQSTLRRMGYGMGPSVFEHDGHVGYYDLPSTSAYRTIEEKTALMMDWNRGWILGTQIAHEVYPGHHFQIFMASQNPRTVRKNAGYDVSSMFIEGWGVYGEDLMHSLGFHQANPRIRLTQLQNRLWRTARVVLDPSIHTGGMTWKEAKEFFMKAGLPEEGAALEATVVTMSPAREASYYMGKLEIEKLVAEARERDDASFDEKAFYTKLLLLGGTPPKLARKELFGIKGR